MKSTARHTLTRRAVPFGAICVVVLAGCAVSNPFRDSIGRPLPGGHELRGIASWYGPGFNGKTTASGERFRQNEMTAAHKTLPFGTIVRVTNLQNSRSVQVRINDRGPFIDGRIIDMSKGSARKLNMIQAGIVPVELRIVKMGTG